ncbi:MAG TPA: hypothetical protein VLH56_16960 [Dissulfurispiraceae bacterium]|nr:hypothetical protein [Dissulfurispiraceae bacterium]
MDRPLINGTRHSWASIRANILGRTVTGITAIAYEDKQEKANNYGAGAMPVSRGLGRYEATCSVTLHAYETEAIQRSLGIGKRLQDIAPFDIVVSFVSASDQLVTHVIRNCEFTNNKRDMSQGDTVIEVQHELVVSHIEWI